MLRHDQDQWAPIVCGDSLNYIVYEKNKIFFENVFFDYEKIFFVKNTLEISVISWKCMMISIDFPLIKQ